MAKLTNVTTTSEITATPRAIDFATRFSTNIFRLLEIMGVSNMIEQAPGTQLYVRKGSITLASSVAEGYEIPLSLASVTETSIGTITLEKYDAGVTAEAIQKHGYDIAVGKVDEALENKVRGKILAKFYSFLSTGTLSCSASGFQATLAKSIGKVKNYFKKNDLSYTGTVAFVNIDDFYTYLGSAQITVQNDFGFFYIKNFLGAEVIILCDDDCVASGTMYVTAVNNIVGYFCNAANADFARAGLVYYTDASGLVGAAETGEYNYAVSRLHTLIGIVIAAEYLDGICVGTIA